MGTSLQGAAWSGAALLNLQARRQPGQTTCRKAKMEGNKKDKIKCIAFGLNFHQWECERYGYTAGNSWCCSKRAGDQGRRTPLPPAVNLQFTQLRAAACDLYQGRSAWRATWDHYSHFCSGFNNIGMKCLIQSPLKPREVFPTYLLGQILAVDLSWRTESKPFSLAHLWQACTSFY